MNQQVLAIDLGLKRVGLAVGVETLKIATPLKIVPFKEAEDEILKIIEERSILLIVMGLPLHADGKESDMCLKVRKFSRRLARRANIQIIFVDEFGSSLEADENTFGLVLNRSPRGCESNDDRAAAKILTRYFAGEGIVK